MHKRSLVITGGEAQRAYDALPPNQKLFWNFHHAHTPGYSRDAVMRIRQYGSRALDSLTTGAAQDSVGSSGLAFLVSQLEMINPRIIEPLHASTYARHITVKTGGGFPDFTSAFAANYGTTGGQYFGLQGTSNTDVPEAQADLQKGTWPAFNWSNGFTISWFDLQKWATAKAMGQPPPISLQKLFENSIEINWQKGLDWVTYFGFLGNPGLVNNTDVPASVAAATGSGSSTTWSSKTPAQILTDVNQGINQTVFNSGYAFQQGAANTLLVPYTVFQTLTQPMAIGGVGYDSTISYIKKNCVAAHYGIDFNIEPLPDPWIAGLGIGNTLTATPGAAVNGNGLNRGVFYRNDDECLILPIPTVKIPAMTLPSDQRGPSYRTFFAGNIGCVNFLRTTTMFYLDGI